MEGKMRFSFRQLLGVLGICEHEGHQVIEQGKVSYFCGRFSVFPTLSFHVAAFLAHVDSRLP